MVLRSGLLWLSGRDEISKFLRRNRLARSAASRFVAGETPEEAVAVVRSLDARGLTVTLDLLGESITEAAEAVRARDQIIQLLGCIATTGIDGHVSLKLTQLGLDVDDDLCRSNMEAILDRAGQRGTFVRIDMEGSAYTDRTLRLFRDHLHPRYGDRVGVVLQTCLRRTEADLENMLEIGARVRLVKGAYAEPPAIAFEKKQQVDAAFRRMTERLLTSGR